MNTYELWTHDDCPDGINIPEDMRVRWVYDDEIYQTRGSYAYDAEEETKAAEENEIYMLDRGEWVVLGYIVEKLMCDKCKTYEQTDSLWGIVIEPITERMVEFFLYNYPGSLQGA